MRRLDTGLIFERDAGAQGQRTQTLEPRLVYSYVPYRNQNELPIFDTGLPDMNLVELFRTNRYVGDDRIGDANQVAFGMTTRLFNQSTGTQYLVRNDRSDPLFHVAAGHSCPTRSRRPCPGRRWPPCPGSRPWSSCRGRICRPCPGKRSPACPGETPQTYHASDIVTEISVTAYKNWSVNLDYQWNPYTSQTDKSEVLVQYRPDPTKVVNLGYRFQQDILKQYDGSFAWPIGGHWNTVGRWVYSLQDRQTIEQLAGIRIQKLLLAIPGGAAPLRHQSHRGTRYLDCITIGTDGPEFGRKASGCLFVEGDQRIFDARPECPVISTLHESV